MLQKKEYFEAGIMACIIANTLVLTIKWYDQPEIVGTVTEIFNYFFAFIFTTEAAIKLIGLGSFYFKDGWNIFDFTVVIATIVGIVVSAASDIEVGATATIIRAFRIFRVFRLVKRAKSLRVIFNTLVSTLPAMVNVGGLLMLFLYLFAILSINLFATVK